MPRRAPVVEIRRSPDGVKEVEAPLPSNLWCYSSDGSRWFHTYSVIIIPQDSSSLHFSTTLHTAKGDVLITMSPSVNVSGRLVVVNDGWVNHCIFQMRSRTPEGLRASYRE